MDYSMQSYDRELRKALIALSEKASKRSDRLESWSKALQMVSSAGTFLILIYGTWAITRLDSSIKTAELPSKIIAASYDKQQRIRVESNLNVEHVGPSATGDMYQAALSFKCTNISKSAYTITSVVTKFFRGDLVSGGAPLKFFKINPPGQREDQPIHWTDLQTDAYVGEETQGKLLQGRMPSIKIHRVGPAGLQIGPTGLLNSDEVTTWEDDYRFPADFGDFVGFIVSVDYGAEGPWEFQEWGSIPKTPAKLSSKSGK